MSIEPDFPIPMQELRNSSTEALLRPLREQLDAIEEELGMTDSTDLDEQARWAIQFAKEYSCRELGATDEDIKALRHCMGIGTHDMYIRALQDVADELKVGERRILDAAREAAEGC